MDISRHPILKEAYEVCQAIEESGASEKLTAAVIKAGDLMSSIDKLLDEATKLKTAKTALLVAKDRIENNANEFLLAGIDEALGEIDVL